MSPKLTLLMLAGVAVLGCSRQDFTRSFIRSPVSEFAASGTPRVEPGTARVERRAAKLAQTLAAWQAQHPRPAGAYTLGPGDVVAVGILALESPGQTATLARTVSHSGHIALPWVGDIQAGGQTVAQLEESIRAAYAGRYLKDPQLAVTVKEHRSASVLVTGAVSKPAVFHLTRSASTVLEILTRAGGLGKDAGDELLITRSTAASARDRGTASVAIDLVELVDKANLALNVEVMSGDILTVPPRAANYVYVLGYVRSPGAYELRDGMRVDAMRAVALSGGLLSNARAHNCHLLRETPDGQQLIRLDLNKVARGVAPPVPLRSGDTLVVGSSLPSRLAEYIKPSASVGASMAP